MMQSFSSCLWGDPTNLPSPVRDCRRAWCSEAVLPAERCVPALARPGVRRAAVAATVRVLRLAPRVAFAAVPVAILGAAAATGRGLRPEHWACAMPLRGDGPSRRGFARPPRSLRASVSPPSRGRDRAVRAAARQRAVRRVLQAARVPEPACERGSAGAAVPDAPKARRRAPLKYRVAAVPGLPAACRLGAGAGGGPAGASSVAGSILGAGRAGGGGGVITSGCSGHEPLPLSGSGIARGKGSTAAGRASATSREAATARTILASRTPWVSP